MEYDKFARALQLMNNYKEHLSALGPQDEEAIAGAEAQIGYSFPEAYRRFVAEFGTLSFLGEEIFGVIGNKSQGRSIPNVVWATMNQRKTIGLSNCYLPIYAVGDGDFIYLILSAPNYGCIVSLIRKSDNGFEEVPEFSSFEKWLLFIVEQAIKDFNETD